MTLHAAHLSAVRARGLLADLERSNHVTDRAQVAAGIGHELDTVIGVLRGELERLATAATGDRPGKVRNDASEPSRVTARAITLKTGTARHTILAALWRYQNEHRPDNPWAERVGLTDLHLQMNLRLNPNTERPRRGELVDAGLVESIGTTIQRNTVWTVWAITQGGADAIAQHNQETPRVVTPTGQPTLF